MSIEPIAMGEIQPEATLEDCEQALHNVERNAAIQQGVILRHVRDHRLYSAAGFPSFAEYVEQRLGYTDRWARQRIDLADTVAAIGTMVPDHAIENERQARAIKPILRDHGPEVAAEVLAEAEASGRVTARSITEAAERVIEPEVISAEEFVERYDADNEPTPDLDTLIPTDQRFRLRFAKRLLATHDLLTDMDYPQYFDDEMAERLARFVDNLTRKHTEFSKSRRTLRVVQGGNP